MAVRFSNSFASGVAASTMLDALSAKCSERKLWVSGREKGKKGEQVLEDVTSENKVCKKAFPP